MIAETAAGDVGRGRMYGLLSRLTGAPPTRDILAGVCALDAVPPDALPSGSAGEAFALLKASARRCLEDAGEWAAARDDHQRLYVGPGALPAPIWESVYRDPEHILFGADTLAVRAFYARFGLAFPARAREPDDHIAFELEFLCRLLAAGLECLERGDGAEYRRLCAARLEFLDEHLLRWAPQSFSMQKEHAATGLYAGLARLLIEYPALDAEHLHNTFQGERT